MASFGACAETLPVLGVGASLSFGAEPDPVGLAKLSGGPSFIEYAGAVQPSWMQAPLQALRARGVPVLYHPSCLNLCGPWRNPTPWVDAVAHHVRAVGSAWLAQDVAVCFVEHPGYSNHLGYFVPPVLTRASLDQAVDRVLEVTERLEVPLLLEPAPVVAHTGTLSIFEWLSTLAERTDCGLLLDAGHVVSHQLAEGRGLTDGLSDLDGSRVVEIHVAGGALLTPGTRQVYVDAHDLPILPETWRVLHALLGVCPSLRAVCVECEGMQASTVLGMLRMARERVAHGTVSEALRERVAAELS